MTLLELVKELNDFIAANPVESQLEVDTVNTEIVFENGLSIDWNYDEEYPSDNCDYEMGFDPYLGCFSDDC